MELATWCVFLILVSQQEFITASPGGSEANNNLKQKQTTSYYLHQKINNNGQNVLQNNANTAPNQRVIEVTKGQNSMNNIANLVLGQSPQACQTLDKSKPSSQVYMLTRNPVQTNPCQSAPISTTPCQPAPVTTTSYQSVPIPTTTICQSSPMSGTSYQTAPATTIPCQNQLIKTVSNSCPCNACADQHIVQILPSPSPNNVAFTNIPVSTINIQQQNPTSSPIGSSQNEGSRDQCAIVNQQRSLASVLNALNLPCTSTATRPKEMSIAVINAPPVRNQPTILMEKPEPKMPPVIALVGCPQTFSQQQSPMIMPTVQQQTQYPCVQQQQPCPRVQQQQPCPCLQQQPQYPIPQPALQPQYQSPLQQYAPISPTVHLTDISQYMNKENKQSNLKMLLPLLFDLLKEEGYECKCKYNSESDIPILSTSPAPPTSENPTNQSNTTTEELFTALLPDLEENEVIGSFNFLKERTALHKHSKSSKEESLFN